jgi:hypothetical protein
MPDIYTKEWYEAMLVLANSRDDLAAKVPQGEWRVALEIMGDGKSPYIPEGSAKYYFIVMKNGKIVEFTESPEKLSGSKLNYRITGPAKIFDEMAAGVVDPVEKSLDGSLGIKGDMRILLQNADIANLIFDVYAESGLTDWPKGKPPYER